ncbi:S41 family peptidase [Microlunatus sp. GCM10028923]|uniref:S41 family peptidase n=1 Tax=Microlunatus sp. GCM10028923 TaxID=3273400 RepID=UPI00360A8C69
MTTTLLDDLERLVRNHYILEPAIDPIVTALHAGGPLPEPPEELAGELTRRLQSVNHDGHLRVRHRPDGAIDGFDSDAYERKYAAEARTNSGGIKEVRRIQDGVWLLGIAPYLSEVHLAAPYVEAAFTLLADARHLVIDVRETRGGTPETVALICSQLTGRQPVHLQDMVFRGAPPRQFWTRPVPRPLRPDLRVDVLTGSGTVSGGEELAYNLQALGRATVIGETTGGGAHPVEAFRLTEVLETLIPIARSVNAVTGTNWEQVGVVPDHPCPAADALDVALATAGPLSRSTRQGRR